MQGREESSWARLAVLAALLAWSGAIVRGGISFDDREVILENPIVAGSLPWTAALGRDYMHHVGDAGQYRPLATLTFTADHALWGESPWGYHLSGVLLHAAVVGLAASVLARLRIASRAAALGLVGFALHPVLADSVAWIAGRTSMLSALGGLVGLWVLAGARRPAGPVVAGFALLLGLLAKEDAIVFAPAYLAVAFSRSRRDALAVAAGLLIAVVLYLAMRARALGAIWPSALNAPLAAAPLLERLEVGGRAWLEGARLVLAPLRYPPRYSLPSLGDSPGESSFGPTLFGVAGVLAAVALPCAGLAWARWARALRRDATPGLSLALAALAALPLLQLLPTGEPFAPRFLYLPLLLAVPALGALFERLPRALLVVLAGVALVLAWQRAGVYASRASHAEAILARVPGDARAWNELGLAREEGGALTGARTAWERSAATDPGYGRPYSNLARLAVARDALDEAERLLRRAVELGPANPTARCNLGAVLLRRGRATEAADAYRRATELAPGLAPAWRGLGHALARAGEPAARQALERALALDPRDELALRLLAGLEGD